MLALPAAPSGRLRRRAQHLLPPGDDRRPGRAGVPGGPDAGAHRAAGSRVGLRVRWPGGCLAAAGAWHALSLRALTSIDRDAALWAGWAIFVAVFVGFFRRPDIGRILAFLLLYRFAEAQLLKLVGTCSLLDAPAAGGLGLKTRGGAGLRHHRAWPRSRSAGCWAAGDLAWAAQAPAVAADDLHAPAQPGVRGAGRLAAPSLWLISAAVAVEQFGYGFGFTAYMVYMMMVAGVGEHKTAHHAICTGFHGCCRAWPPGGCRAGWGNLILVWCVAHAAVVCCRRAGAHRTRLLAARRGRCTCRLRARSRRRLTSGQLPGRLAGGSRPGPGRPAPRLLDFPDGRGKPIRLWSPTSPQRICMMRFDSVRSPPAPSPAAAALAAWCWAVSPAAWAGTVTVITSFPKELTHFHKSASRRPTRASSSRC